MRNCVTFYLFCAKNFHDRVTTQPASVRKARSHLLHPEMKRTHAFTLMELLVAVAIVCILAALLVGALSYGRKEAARSDALTKMRRLGAGLFVYTAEHDGELPPEGESLPTWESAGEPENANAWYNSIPPLAEGKALADYANAPASFYEKANLLFHPTARYPDSRMGRPYFAVSYNSKLRSPKSANHNVRLANLVDLNRTVLFQESGLPGEKTLPGQEDGRYDGQSKSYASRTVAREKNQTLMVFADGHGESKRADTVVNPEGKAFFPQVGPNGGEVVWTADPNANPND
jgi:prepilin-type N-terminal cleavage/methylation domain-containing protein